MSLSSFVCTVKWFQVFLSNINNSIQYISFVCLQWKDFKYFYLTLIILFNTIHLFAYSEEVSSIAI